MTSEEAVSLKEFFLHKIADMDKQTSALAVQMEKRLDGMNEFRQSLKEQNNTFMSRSEINSHFDKIDEMIQDLAKSRDIATGKASQTSVNIVTILAIISLLISAFTLLLRIKG